MSLGGDMMEDLKSGNVDNVQRLYDASKEETLNLSECQITDKQAQIIADVLNKNNKNITQLYLSNNAITDVGASAIQQALEINDSLILVDLSGNAISPEIREAISKSLHRNMGKKVSKVPLKDSSKPLYDKEEKNPDETPNNETPNETPTISISKFIASAATSTQQSGSGVNNLSEPDEISIVNLYDLREPLPPGYMENEQREVVMHLPKVQDSSTTSRPSTSISNPIAAAVKIEETIGNTQG